MYNFNSWKTKMQSIVLASPLLMASFVPAIAQTSIKQIEPRPPIEPLPKAICKHDGKFYQQQTVMNINGKKYICTLNGWVLFPSFNFGKTKNR